MPTYVSRANTNYSTFENSLWVSGNDSFGSRYQTSSPVQWNQSPNNWRDISISSGIKIDGTLWTWGTNSYGQIGDGTRIHRSSPVQTISGGTNWNSLDSSGNFIAAIKSDGTLWSWGSNYQGQLGDSTSVHRSSPVQTIAGGTNWKQVSCGFYGAAAIKTDGTLWTWGHNSYGMLGDNTFVGARSSPVQTAVGGTNWKQVSMGAATAAAVKTDGTLWTWGSNLVGSLGVNVAPESLASVFSPVQTIGNSTIWTEVKISKSNFLASAIKTDGTLWSWGTNSYGSLGDNTRIHRSSPVQTISGGTNWQTFSVGQDSIFAIKTDGTLWNWGHNGYGQLGDNTITNRSSPVQTVVGGTNWRQIAGAGSVFNALRGVTTDLVASGLVTREYLIDVYPSLAAQFKTAGLYTWGPYFNSNLNGQLGTGNTTDRSSPGQTIAGGSNWKQGSSDAHIYNWRGASAAVKTDGTLWTWGYNGYGMLGDNTNDSKSSPVQTIAGGTNWREVSCGGTAVAAIKTDGTLWLWGGNYYGILGINLNSKANPANDRSSPVQTIAGGTNWKQISASDPMGAVKTDGTLWMWGSNTLGSLGTGNLIHRSSPVQTITGGTNWKLVSTDNGVAGAIKTDGTLWMWGAGSSGQIGNNSTTNRSSPVQTVAGGNNWKQIAVGYQSVAAIKTDGTLWLWGKNSYGDLGRGTNGAESASPAQTIAGGTNWSRCYANKNSVTGGHGALKTDGSLWFWGRASFHLQGTKSSPVQLTSGGYSWKNIDINGDVAIAIKDDSEDPI